MPETIQTQREISELTTRIANVEQMVRFSLSASREAKAYAKEHFESKKNSAQLYILLDEPKTQEQLSSLLRMSAPNVSKLCSHLEEQGFVSREKSLPNKKVPLFRWNELERLLGLSKIASACVKATKK